MARDYAARSRKRSTKPGGLPGWVWLTAGLSMGLVIAVVVYIGRPAQPMPSVTARQQQSATNTAKKPRVEVPPAEDPEFDFYRLLEDDEEIILSTEPSPRPAPQASRAEPPTANAEAKPVPEPKAPTPPSANTSTSTPPPGTTAQGTERYIILAGSFKNPDYAERHKASLALAGIESQIETVTTSSQETFHRVRIGPRESLDSAKAVVRQLEINGFKGRVVLQR